MIRGPLRITSQLCVVALIALPALADEAGMQSVSQRLQETGLAIRGAVERGELPAEDARALWEEKRDFIFAEALDAGEVTELVADHLRQEVNKHESRERRQESVWHEIRELGSMVKSATDAGDISDVEAREMWESERDAIFDDALASGQLSRGEAATMRQQLSHAELDHHLTAAGESIKAQLASGALTEREAWERWYETKDALIAEAVASGDISRHKADEFHHNMRKAELAHRLDEARSEIQAAYAAGNISRMDAKVELRVRKQEIVDETVLRGELLLREANEVVIQREKEGLGWMLKQAVENGAMTEEEAKAEWAEYADRWQELHAAGQEAGLEQGAGFEQGALSAQRETSPALDEWARYTRTFISRHNLDGQRERAAWRFYEATRNRATPALQRLERPIDADENPERAAARSASVEREMDRLFEQLKQRLDSLVDQSAVEQSMQSADRD